MKMYLFLLTILLSSGVWSKPTDTINEMVAEAETANWEKGVSESIIINAPVEDVWDYGSDSTRATDWSVFFDHITPLPGIPDGNVGARRRCFRNADETGEYWDEIAISSVKYQFRQIITYNLTNFRPNFLASGGHMYVRQYYRAIDAHTTEMTFQTQYPANANWKTKLSARLTKKKTAKIFKENLENIKANIEGTPRVHAWY